MALDRTPRLRARVLATEPGRETLSTRGNVLEQQTVALDADIEPSWLSHIESGRQNPAWGTVDRIARALEWSLWELAKLADELETEDRRPTDKPLRPRD